MDIRNSKVNANDNKRREDSGSYECRYPYRMDRDKRDRHGSKFSRGRGLCDHMVSTCQSTSLRAWVREEGACDIDS